MTKTFFAPVFLAGLGYCCFALPAAALPLTTQSAVSADHGGLVEPVRSKRYRMRRDSSDAGNAGMPSRRPAARQHGQTTGGPRR